MRKLNASTTIYLIFSIFIILALCAFAVDLNIVYTTRSELQTATEEIALAKAMGEATENALKFASYGNLKDMTITTDSSDGDKHTIETQTLAMPYFTAVMGISGIKLKAKAIAVKKELTVTNGSSGRIKWVNASTMYESDIITSSGEEKDSYIQHSIDTKGGNLFNASYSYTQNGTSYNTTPLWETISSNGLNLGPGGYITIKMPVPILDKPGDDFSIEEAGDFKDGYKVYAGIDKDSKQPYVNADTPQGGVYWVQLTGGQCSDSGEVQSDTYFCSTTFDIAQDGLSMVKYLMIVDDNEQKGYIQEAGDIVEVVGESSTVTAGADIKDIKILNYVTLVKE